MNDNFIKELKRNAREKDSITFKEYRVGWITFHELKEQVFANNKMTQETRDKTTDEEFHDWIRMLGWDE